MRSLFVLFLAALPASAAEFDAAKLLAIRERFERFVEGGDVPGAVFVVGSKDFLTVQAAGRGVPKDAVFRIASMTKPMVAVAVQILAEEGKLAVTDPVEKHLPEFKGQMLIVERDKGKLTLATPKRPITLRDLLTHTSGLGAYPPGFGEFYLKRDRTLAEATLAVSQRPLEFEPGSKWAYCNSGIDTLGRVVEKVSGKPFEAFMKERIFDPVGMKDTTFHPSAEQLKRAAKLYDKKDGMPRLVPDATLLGPPGEGKHPIPAGGLYSTGYDVGMFYRTMLNGGLAGTGKRLLKPESVKEMTSVHTGELNCGFTEGMGFGHGFAVVRKPQGPTAALSAGSFGHGGAFGTQSWADPTKGVFVVLMIQRVGLPNADASAMRTELQRMAMEAVK